MKLGIYSIYDKLTGYMLPNFQVNDKFAIRGFKESIKDPEMALIKANPGDFTLCRIGNFDSDTGVINQEDIKILCDAGALIREDE